MAPFLSCISPPSQKSPFRQSWIDEDRMAGVTTPAGTITYTYDADNARVAVDDGATVTNYLIDTRQQYAQVVAEYEDPATPTVEYVFGLERIAQDRGGSVVVYIADGQGSIRQLTGSAGNVTDSYSYFAFGEELSSSGSTVNEFRFVGEQFDPNAGFYYNRARWYSPSIGRFTSVDPSAGKNNSPISLHRYLYGNSSPLSYSDPSGNFAIAVLSYFAISTIIRDGYSIASSLWKKDCNCGKDVSEALMVTYDKVKERFDGADENKVCAPFRFSTMNFTKASENWDLDALVHGWELFIKPSKQGANCKGCKETARVGGGCYDVWNINYFSYGWINKLCNNSLANLLLTIQAWKTVGIPIKRKELPEASGSAIQWALLGREYDGGSTVRGPTASLKFMNCKACGEAFTGDLESRWP